MSDVVIVSATRTPIGTFNGALELACRRMGWARSRSRRRSSAPRSRPAEVSEVIMGQILTAAQGQNPARQASIGAGIPNEVPAYGVNILCGSGLKAVALGYQAILNGDSSIVVAGGQESMSMAPHAAYLRSGAKMGSRRVRRHHAQGRPDGRLPRLPHGQHCRERGAEVADHPRGAGPLRRGLAEQGRGGDQGRPLQGRDHAGDRSTSRKGDVVVDTDEFPRFGTTMETVGKLRPAFAKDGSVTAANASGINDGAAALVLMSAEEARRRGLTPLARAGSSHRIVADSKFRRPWSAEYIVVLTLNSSTAWKGGETLSTSPGSS